MIGVTGFTSWTASGSFSAPRSTAPENRKERHRRVHMLAFAPSLDVVERINSVLEPRGALHSDGRPSIRATPRDLVSILLDIDPRCYRHPGARLDTLVRRVRLKVRLRLAGGVLRRRLGAYPGHRDRAVQRSGHELADAGAGRPLDSLVLGCPLPAQDG